MSYQFIDEELLEISNKIPKYSKHVFFEKKNKYALLIPVARVPNILQLGIP